MVCGMKNKIHSKKFKANIKRKKFQTDKQTNLGKRYSETPI
jgi:hypothetical protein